MTQFQKNNKIDGRTKGWKDGRTLFHVALWKQSQGKAVQKKASQQLRRLKSYLLGHSQSSQSYL